MRTLVKGCDISPKRIVIISDCAGSRRYYSTENAPDNALLSLAHLTLMLLRYLKDESSFEVPAGIVLCIFSERYF